MRDVKLDIKVSVERISGQENIQRKCSKVVACLACSGGTVAGLEMVTGRKTRAKRK